MSKRYIDADKLVARINASPVFSNMGTDGFFIRECVLNLIDCLSAADVVEVVRCRDCKYYRRYEPPIEDFDGCCNVNEIECDKDFYCQYGERKEQ